MAILLTSNTIRALEEPSIEPNLIIRVEGHPTLYSAINVREFLTYGYPDTFYGDDDLFYGGLINVTDNKTYIDVSGTSFVVKQQMSYDDEAGASSISSMTIGLIDKNAEITRLITPGQQVPDMLGRKIDVFLTIGDTSFFEDSVQIFKGIVTKIDYKGGAFRLKLNHPDAKKKVELFQKVSTALNGNITASQTSITVDSTLNFLVPQDALTCYIRIEDELIQYTTTTSTTFGTLTRGALGTTATAHNDNEEVTVLYALEDNPFDLALKLMLSGHGTDPVHEDIEVTSFVRVGAGVDTVANAIYFDQVNIEQDYGISIGDTVTTTGATNAANNVTTRTVTDIQRFESGFYIVVDGAALVQENTTSAEMDLFSQYNTLPTGMMMRPEEVDIAEHIRIRNFFFSSTEYRIFLKANDIDGKDFLDEQIYRPIACYSLPRKTRASVGYTVGPIPGEQIITIDETVVRNPANLTVSRSTNRSFFNEVVYRFEDNPSSTDENFLRGDITTNETSVTRLSGFRKTFIVSSIGLRTDLNADNIISSNRQRILDRYKFAAEIFSCRAMFRDTLGVEIGDVVVGDFSQLQIPDISNGTRNFEPRLLEVLNKSVNFKTGQVDLMMVDTGLNIDTRFGLISPCSLINGVVSSSQFSIGPNSLYPSRFGENEFRKWESVISINEPVSIRVRNEDFSIDQDLVVTNINENLFTLQDPSPITLTEGLFVEFSGYIDTETSDKQKLIYAYMTNAAAFPDGGEPYSMI